MDKPEQWAVELYWQVVEDGRHGSSAASLTIQRAFEERERVLREALKDIAEATSAEDDAGENYRWDDREGALDYAYATATAALKDKP